MMQNSDSVILELYCPNLRKTEYRVTSPQSNSYNCIAWAAGFTDRPWWPIDRTPYYWPIEPRIESLDSFTRVFQSLGYEVCDNGELEDNYEKVAIYIYDDGEPSHMTRQLATGQWTSKCGDFEDITHILEGLEGDYYGTVAVFMKRPVSRQ